MSDTNAAPIPAPAVDTPVLEVTTPVATTVVPASVEQTSLPLEAPAESATAVAGDALPVEAPVEAEPVEEKPTLAFSDEAESSEAKPDEKPVEATGEVAAEGQQPEVTYEFKFPEGVEAAKEQIDAYTSVLKEHKVPPEAAQRFLDLHLAEVQRHTEAIAEHLATERREQGKKWLEEIKGDPELGGSGFETVKKAVMRGRDMLVPASDRQAFNEFLAKHGMGENPVLWRMFYRAARRFDEPSPPPPNIRPTPQVPPRTGRAVLFDHPSSAVRR